VKDFPPHLRFRQPWNSRSLRADLCALLATRVLALGTPGLHSQTICRPFPEGKSKLGSQLSASKTSASKIAVIKSFRIVQEKMAGS
jgi:hypothetical protein